MQFRFRCYRNPSFRIERPWMFLSIDQMASNVVFNHFRHETGHRATHTGDEMQNLLAASVAFEGPFDRLDLAPHPANAGQQLLLFADGMGHIWDHSIGGNPIAK